MKKRALISLIIIMATMLSACKVSSLMGTYVNENDASSKIELVSYDTKNKTGLVDLTNVSAASYNLSSVNESNVKFEVYAQSGNNLTFKSTVRNKNISGTLNTVKKTITVDKIVYVL